MKTHLIATMTKPKTWFDLEPSLDADWPPHQPVTLTELVAEARALDWDFTNWCCARGMTPATPMHARNRDHHSSDPCGQDRKQQKVSQKHGHTDASPFHLALQSVGLCSISDSRTIITNCFPPASPRVVRPVGLAKICSP